LGNLIGYGLALALSLLSNLTAVFVAFGSQAISLFAGKSRRRFWKVAAVHLLVAVVFIPWIVHAWGEWIAPRLDMPESAAPLRGETTFTPMALPFAFYTLSVGFTLGPSLAELHVDRSREFLTGYWREIAASMAVFGFVFLSGVFHLYSKKREQFPILATWFLTPILLVSLLGVLNIKPFNTRYILVAWPVYLIVLAAGVAGLRRNLFVFAIGAITALSFASLANHYFSEKYWKEDSRGAAEFIHQQTGPDSKIMAYSIVGPLRWYLPDREVTQIHPAQTTKDEIAREVLVRHTEGVSEFWLVTGRDWAADPNRRVRKLVDEMFAEDMSIAFNGVEVSKHSKRED
jgi:hypothetical protein